MRRTRRIYKRKTRSNLETLIILVGAIIILSVAFYMARERSYLPPESFLPEEKPVYQQETTKISDQEQEPIEKLTTQDISVDQRIPEIEETKIEKKVEKEVSTSPSGLISPENDLINKSNAAATTITSKPEVTISPTEKTTSSGSVYTVQVGYFSVESNARNLSREIENRGFKTFVIKHNNAFKVQVGSYPLREQAEEAAQQLKRWGYETWVTQR